MFFFLFVGKRLGAWKALEGKRFLFFHHFKRVLLRFFFLAFFSQRPYWFFIFGKVVGFKNSVFYIAGFF
jgi:hypothetical protein